MKHTEETGFCSTFMTAISQREDQTKRGKGKINTGQYEKLGCYSGCKADDTKCSGYQDATGIIEESEIEKYRRLI